MSCVDLERLECLYEAIQARYPVEVGSPALAEAAHFGSNRSRPIHRWFHFKEGFSAELFDALGLDTSSLFDPDNIFLDPFCGSGTTLLAGDLQGGWRGRRIGLEINPFVAFIARTKVSWREYDPVRIAQNADELLADPLGIDVPISSRPALSTLQNPDVFPPDRLSELLDILQRINQLNVPESAPLLVGVAAAAEQVAFYRKDGRALRILRSPGELAARRALTVEDALRRCWSVIAEDLESVGSQRGHLSAGQGGVVVGDGRRIELPQEMAVQPGEVSLIAYSPPYLNHIDYTEVYKIELWLLGFVKTRQEMLDLRRKTFRSHASIGISSASLVLPEEIEDAVSEAAAAVKKSQSPWHNRFPKLADAYLEDMRTSLQHQFDLLRPGGRAVCVIANSAHGAKEQRVPIAIDLFIARIAEEIGFDVERFVVARQLVRRDHMNRFLRETVVVMRRPS